ncbi:MAG: radical SAM family heme chaperone HemW [Woeseiaceae bacterium]|nr:radical SAM family heme chaperone HemW [Woeseiaceae bacterium]NIP20715.1 radical SAM family heme chaperone HemW [Woeseiaceae bacterium]NIS89508.1 radical SAM family heme chaperone HemW [Woeseiaceae bacterium]
MGDDAPRDRYIEALLNDLDAEAQRAGNRELISVFLGGGTPSVFSPRQIGRLLDRVGRRFALAEDIEVTMEANPGTVECGDPAGYRKAGVSRLSVGAQSFSRTALRTLGRIHSVDDIRCAVIEAREAGFDNINLDIMYGLPGQDVTSALIDLERATRLEINHLSWYQLTLEPNTIFHARPPADMPGDEKSAEIQDSGQRLLGDLGYEQYEVSAWARGGVRCRHNVNYWSFGDYLAAGAGAHGKITSNEGVWRYAKPANPKQYMENIESDRGAATLEPVGNAERLFEFMLNVLRLVDDFDEQLFTSRTGLSADLLRERLETPIARRLIERSGPGSWRVTALGRRFLNDLQAEFLPDRSPN